MADFAAAGRRLRWDRKLNASRTRRTEAAMGLRLNALMERLRRRRAGRRPYPAWLPTEPLVPQLRGWPVDPPRR
jgi:hypothetical protein